MTNKEIIDRAMKAHREMLESGQGLSKHREAHDAMLASLRHDLEVENGFILPNGLPAQGGPGADKRDLLWDMVMIVCFGDDPDAIVRTYEHAAPLLKDY